jgi:hypothetical protein
MLIAAILWLLVHAVSLDVQECVVELYRGSGYVPFTLRIWWELIPWAVVAFLIVDSILIFKMHPTVSSFRRREFLCIGLCVLAGLYFVVCCVPLNVMLCTVKGK